MLFNYEPSTFIYVQQAVQNPTEKYVFTTTTTTTSIYLSMNSTSDPYRKGSIIERESFKSLHVSRYTCYDTLQSCGSLFLYWRAIGVALRELMFCCTAWFHLAIIFAVSGSYLKSWTHFFEMRTRLPEGAVPFIVNCGESSFGAIYRLTESTVTFNFLCSEEHFMAHFARYFHLLRQIRLHSQIWLLSILRGFLIVDSALSWQYIGL